MSEAIRILFEQRFGNERVRLFESRLDLVIHLLNDEDSPYRLPEEKKVDVDSYSRHRNKLQSYISQILSGTGTRKITPEFNQTLKKLIVKKLKGINGVDPIALSDNIMKSLSEGNTKQPEELEEYLHDFKTSNYAVIFTSRPLELEANPNDIILKIRNATVDGICNHFLENFLVKQKYKYNFPNSHLGILFWRRLAYLLITKLKSNEESLNKIREYINNARVKNSNWEEQYQEKLKALGIKLIEENGSERSLKNLVDRFLTLLNESASFQVFETKEPVFVIPHIVLDPNESNNLKGYIFLDHKTGNIELYKYSYRDLIVWKEKVWDTIKANKNTKSIHYITSIEDTVTLNFI